eukprot:CAMPEP_0113506042 /NCGR_PEP_ID=MMETSP0014_2-20120614/35676_1 /TAXON_ID=2857 /ORGANISM="Nitzschia sp." /LENGTH=300 /DNA_ID=CAMNT_0000401469 /DNA_START=62 /DNA_END=961 /DNA_ORIENTATION=+ /assembly_acc=CAM_ASM_000159
MVKGKKSRDDDDDEGGTQEAILDVTISRNSKKKAGFEVEKRPDGYYYISKVPPNYTKINVGDRVMEINGTAHLNFKTAKRANDLIDSFRLEVIPIDDDDEEEEEEEESEDGDVYEDVDRGAAAASSANRGGRGGNDDDDDEDGEDDDDEQYADEDGDYDDDYDDYDSDEEIDEETRLAREAAKANARKRNNEVRPNYGKYKPNERFMITVEKTEPNEDPGVTLVEYQAKWKTEIYVADVRRGPFYSTHLYKGDKILSVNGKKHPKELQTAEQAQDLLESKPKGTMFVMRPDPKKDQGYNW